MQIKASLIPLYFALAQAAPWAQQSGADSAGLQLVSTNVLSASDATALEEGKGGLQRRDIDQHRCYNGGAWMKTSEIDKGIQTWCTSNNGARVPKSKSLNAVYSGLLLGNGKPALFSARYTNDDIVDGWEIEENECVTWMKQVYSYCIGEHQDSQGGMIRVKGYGSIWVDPNQK